MEIIQYKQGVFLAGSKRSESLGLLCVTFPIVQGKLIRLQITDYCHSNVIWVIRRMQGVLSVNPRLNAKVMGLGILGVLRHSRLYSQYATDFAP